MMVQTLPVPIQTMVIRQQGMEIYYPQIYGLKNEHLQQRMNQTIYQHVQRLMHRQYEEQDAQQFEQMIGTYEIKTNERNVLSLLLTNYAFAPHYAHGLTLIDSLTFDLQTGSPNSLEQLFKVGSPYREKLSKEIEHQIKEREIPVIGDFPGILQNQPYYIADKSLVIYYPAYLFTPGYIGSPMFPISVYKLADIVDENGLLGRMMAGS